MTDIEPITEDGFLGGRLRLRQPKRGHRAGHDAILLAAATAVKAGDRVVDFGAGVGAAGLAVACRVPGVALALVEIDPALAALARHNAATNGVGAKIVVLDVASSAANFAAAGLPPDSADAVLTNPPFNDAGRHRASPDAARSLAHQAETGTLTAWMLAARRVLKPGGRLTLIWRAEALAEVLAALDKGFGSLTVLPVHPDPMSAAIRIIVGAVKGGRAPLRLGPALLLNDDQGVAPAAVQAVLRGERALPLSQS
ncbi:tRNA1(Val) (adenine(37)-N6)-methyltransferase [Bradyrhizobium prioriisuperbiae]|uniref:tRNA1(Val) (adenine(37)-N6)-methyltransferase n=1 Tax=Bradyrhizobium prioriisuperbiae TaxID=2854389 RepID=UPI0028E9963F|nr:methyltransferase [Bradyrhizobium prioritasuperba]